MPCGKIINSLNFETMKKTLATIGILIGAVVVGNLLTDIWRDFRKSKQVKPASPATPAAKPAAAPAAAAPTAKK